MKENLLYLAFMGISVSINSWPSLCYVKHWVTARHEISLF